MPRKKIDVTPVHPEGKSQSRKILKWKVQPMQARVDLEAKDCVMAILDGRDVDGGRAER